MLGKFKTAIVLVLIGIISGGLIWGANELTKDSIDANILKQEQDYYRQIFDLADGSGQFTTNVIDGTFVEVVVADDNNNILGYVYKDSDKNNYGESTVLVGINLDGTIAQVIISDTTNTPTFVNKIKTNYLLPFSGQDANDVSYDARTGATYTYGSVSKVVDEATAYFVANRGDAS